jgi:ATP-dependent helicase/DNAse subunit B
MDNRRDEGVLPVFFNKDGSLSKKSAVIPPEQMESLQKHIGRLVRDTARSVACGNVDAAPLALRESPCEWCDYRAACHFDEALDIPRRYNHFPSFGGETEPKRNDC